jgi:hypothetical protein
LPIDQLIQIDSELLTSERVVQDLNIPDPPNSHLVHLQAASSIWDQVESVVRPTISIPTRSALTFPNIPMEHQEAPEITPSKHPRMDVEDVTHESELAAPPIASIESDYTIVEIPTEVPILRGLRTHRNAKLHQKPRYSIALHCEGKRNQTTHKIVENAT